MCCCRLRRALSRLFFLFQIILMDVLKLIEEINRLRKEMNMLLSKRSYYWEKHGKTDVLKTSIFYV